jgi:mannose-1-phosphate guanylyltransferase/mannose-1-phosphate guanylyltransferase/mannose-6-phosphate isomerase
MTRPEKADKGRAMNSLITPVILAGGSGTRLWPLSRAARAKQFLNLIGEDTMIGETLARVGGAPFGPALIVGGAAQADMLQGPAGDDARIILEPEGRNTAPAIALAALALPADAPMLVMPSDHAIADVAAFEAAVEQAAALAGDGWLVTFGIAPTGPETGYGYIREGEAIGGASADGGFRVERFIEKPGRDTAKTFLAEGGYCWNGGIFLFTAGVFLDALDAHAPDIAAAARAAMAGAETEGALIRPDAAAFAEAPAISIDYAVMEKARRVAVVPVAMGWSDIGSWDALYDFAGKDADGNSLSANVLAIDTANSLVRSDGPLVAAIGVSDLVVIATGDAILVMPRGESQRVKQAIEALKNDPERKDLL